VLRIVPRTPILVTFRRVLGAVACLALLSGISALPAVAQTTPAPAAGSQADLEQRLRTAQAAANAAAARFQEATAKHEALRDEITSVEQRITAERARANELRVIARARAVEAYKSRQTVTDAASVVFGSGNILIGIRRTMFLQHANAKDDAAIAELRVLDQDLGIHKNDLDKKRDEAAKLMAQTQQEKTTLEATVADAQRAYDDLVARLAREAASREAAERAARQAVAAARQAAAPAAAKGAAPVVTGTPVGGFLCPVRGPFSNDYGDARSGGRVHGGIDIFAGAGAPVVAVKAGTVSQESGGGGGNAAYLSAGDGNTYYYAHFSSYAASGSVGQGQVIGYVGMTGNASTPHLHFEIRTPSGSINPYPTLVSAC
jgi:murein DD-endopeptidase MepM/ murein hydrolase activator NlpD